jgi:hypothetical protein
MALPGRCTPHKMTTGKQPDLTYLKTFGCEVMVYVERTKRSKFEPKAECCISLGQSSTQSNDTYKLWNIASGKVIYRRNVALNEKAFPGRNMKIITTNIKTDTGEDLVGHDFLEDGDRYTITGTSTNDGVLTMTYINPDKPLKDNVQHESTMSEIRKWYNKTQMIQASNHIRQNPSFINDIAFAAYKAITTD